MRFCRAFGKEITKNFLKNNRLYALHNGFFYIDISLQQLRSHTFFLVFPTKNVTIKGTLYV